MTTDFVTPLALIESREIQCDPTVSIPNNPVLPALLYPQAIQIGTAARQVKALYEDNGWTGTWVYTLFDFHHYHYAAHEALTVIAGRGLLQLGGDGGPEQALSEGDVVILPAGYGHKLLKSEGGFTVVGGYPAGQDDTGFHRAEATAAQRSLASIAATPLPACDPIYGDEGPVMKLWCRSLK